MKKKLFTLLFLVLSTTCFAQIDSTIFKGTLTNKEYNVYLKIDFYDQNIKVPGQEIFGDMAGFFGDYKDGRKWLITEVSIRIRQPHYPSSMIMAVKILLQSCLLLQKENTFLNN